MAKAEHAAEAGGIRTGVNVVALVRHPAGRAHRPPGRSGWPRWRASCAPTATSARVASFREGGPALVASDGRSTYLAVTLRPGDDTEDDALAERLRASRWTERPG